MSKIIIPDVSFYQYQYKDFSLKEITKFINFLQMKLYCPGVILRAGQNVWKDITFDISRKNARTAGLLIGSYWFYDSRAKPKEQAQLWVDIVGDDIGELYMWCDFEDRYNGKYKRWQDWYDFMEYTQELVPNQQLGVYTNYYYWMENTVLLKIPTASLNYFKSYPLWIAWYNPAPPKIPAPWSDYMFWQYTDNGDGKEYGVASGNIDLNQYNGDKESFKKHFGEIRPSTPTPSPTPTPTPIPSIDSMVLTLDNGKDLKFIKE
jgi:hypothetical protein